MNVIHCSRCGNFIGTSEVRFVVGLHVTLDVDGLDNDDWTNALNISKSGTPDRLEEVHELVATEKAFTICSNCRSAFVSDPLGASAQNHDAEAGLLQ
ncbi:MAG: hypothetical protein KC561_05785 [Myxococcales bacterium]|nr:hypothetical protein [Myxococcales bacterium]